MLETYIVDTGIVAVCPAGWNSALAAAPSGDDDPFAGRVAHVEIVREGPGVDDAIAGLREQLPGRPDHQLGQAEALDARRRAKHHPQEEQDRDHHAHAQPEGDDADGGEGARPEEGARGVKQVRNENVHRCVWVDTLDLSRAQIRRPRAQRVQTAAVPLVFRLGTL